MTGLKAAVVLQIVYVALSLLVAIAIWGILGKYGPTAEGSLLGWKFGGPFAGFAFVYYSLNKTGLVDRFIEASGKGVKAEVLLTPVSKKVYATLFDGFNNCDFIAFNSPFKVEEAGHNFLKDALAIHEKRYLENHVACRYLFYEKESYERAKEFFKKLEARVGRNAIKDKLEIRFLEGSQPGYTYFCGLKNDIPACVIYPAARFKGGLPDAVVYLENATNLLNLLKTDFKEKWDEAKRND